VSDRRPTWLKRASNAEAFLSKVARRLGNASVGAVELPTKLAVDILHHHHIRMDVGLASRFLRDAEKPDVAP
jgi:hypothetical protein